jgi:hypothetical protein
MLRILARWLRSFVEKYDPKPPEIITKVVGPPESPYLPAVRALTLQAEMDYPDLHGNFRRRKVFGHMQVVYPELTPRQINLLIEQALN